MYPRPRPHRGRVSFLRQRQNLPGVGLHQCPSERKGEGGPVRSLHAPSHVPSNAQNAAKVRDFSLSASGFTAETDCLLEQGGFELSVPPAGAGLFATSGMEKPEFANDVAGFDRAGLAASLRRLVAHPTVEQHAQRGDEAERLV
jgi:hypothetical protein